MVGLEGKADKMTVGCGTALRMQDLLRKLLDQTGLDELLLKKILKAITNRMPRSVLF